MNLLVLIVLIQWLFWPRTNPVASARTILPVEGETAILDFLRNIFTKEGYAMSFAAPQKWYRRCQ